MKNSLKVVAVVIISFVASLFVQSAIPIDLLHVYTSQASSKVDIIIRDVLSFIIFIILFTFFWILFFKDSSIKGSFVEKVKLKEVYITLVVLFALPLLLLPSQLNNWDVAHTSSHFIGNSIYENSYYHFRLTYPEGSVFANAHPELGVVTRFFLPGGKTIGGDMENVNIIIKKNFEDLDTALKRIKDAFSKNNGPMDIQKVQFGGQKGYRIIFTSDYSANTGTKELLYMTLRNGILYELNYFPVTQNISIADSVASSFEFTQ